MGLFSSPSVWPIPRPSSLCVFDPAQPDEPPRVIHDEPDEAIYDASLSYDARTIFFSAHRPGVEGDWHIYEIGVDGRGLRQLTLGPSANISPVLLPDGRIMFVSTRHGTYVQWQPATAGLLHVMDRDGGNVQRVSAVRGPLQSQRRRLPEGRGRQRQRPGRPQRGEILSSRPVKKDQDRVAPAANTHSGRGGRNPG